MDKASSSNACSHILLDLIKHAVLKSYRSGSFCFILPSKLFFLVTHPALRWHWFFWSVCKLHTIVQEDVLTHSCLCFMISQQLMLVDCKANVIPKLPVPCCPFFLCWHGWFLFFRWCRVQRHADMHHYNLNGFTMRAPTISSTRFILYLLHQMLLYQDCPRLLCTKLQRLTPYSWRLVILHRCGLWFVGTADDNEAPKVSANY